MMNYLEYEYMYYYNTSSHHIDKNIIRDYENDLHGLRSPVDRCNSKEHPESNDSECIRSYQGSIGDMVPHQVQKCGQKYRYFEVIRKIDLQT
jgi:hypothetical protein